ncbi:MAG: hypothetical protein KBD94_03015 [Pyrinomonadaceae bacterium]|nr:hypothetical protein [Pyrinomonadaceae bacterium]
MTAQFSQNDPFRRDAAYDLIETCRPTEAVTTAGVRRCASILDQKISPPSLPKLVARPRITRLLEHSRRQFPATLILGRAGTGKTALAADFASAQPHVFWYSVEATDSDWTIFSRYFSACLCGGEKSLMEGDALGDSLTPTHIARFLVEHFPLCDSGALLILDDLHHIFEAAWFDDLFQLLIYSLPPSTHALMLSRSEPPTPTWRLRSKQLLNVVDERAISFDPSETKALFQSRGITPTDIQRVHTDTFGRISRLLEYVAG